MKCKTEFWILAIIAVIAIIAIVFLFKVQKTGDFIYAGGTMQYETNDVCKLNLDCKEEAVLLGIDGGLNPSEIFRDIALCACSETPNMIYRIPMVQTIKYY